MHSSQQPTVLFVVPTAYLLGGVQVWLEYLINALNNAGFKSICGAVDGTYHSAATYLDYYAFEHVAILCNPVNTRWGRVRAIADTVTSTQADIVVSVNVPDTYAGTQLARQTHNQAVKLVATVHGLEPDYYADIDYAHDLIDAVLVTNRLTAVAIQAFTKIKAESIYYAQYGVQIPSEDDKVARKPRPEGERPPLTILYSGRIETEQKRCHDLVGIAQQLQAQNVQFKLLIAGDGKYRAKLSELLGNTLPTDGYEFLGFVAREDLLQSVLPRCDAMIITSSWETGPIVAWEAMAAGVTVVTSRYLGLEQEAALIDQQNCLVFDVGDVVGAAQALSLVQAPELRLRLNRAALKLVEERYTVARSVAATASVLQQVLQQPIKERTAIDIAALWSATGRLERWLGHRLAHQVRLRSGLNGVVTSAGSEWPHTLGYNQLTEQEFRQQLMQLTHPDD